MKKINTKVLLLLLTGLFSFGHAAKSQDFTEIFKGGGEDAGRYLENYISPMMTTFNNGLNDGWYNTAKPHKLFGFDLTASANFVKLPAADKVWTFKEGDFKNLRLQNGTEPSLPTIFGGPTTEKLVVKGSATIGDVSYTKESGAFDASPGIDLGSFGSIPVPTIQLGIGIVKNTDLKIRYMPSSKAGDFKMTMFGIGVMHDIKQWIPGLKLVPFDLSGFVGYTTLKAKYDINKSTTDLNNYTYEGKGTAEIKTSSTTIQVLISKKLAFFTPYAGLGYNMGSSSLKVKGDFLYSDGLGNKTTIKDPVDISSSNGNSPTLTVGGRLKLLVFTIHADYAIQKYNTFTLGVGLNIR